MVRKYICHVKTCHSEFTSKGSLYHHLAVNHNINPDLPSSLETDDGFNRDELDLVMEESVRDRFRDFVVDDTALEKMGHKKPCNICFSNRVEVAFITCGHMISCLPCAINLMSAKLPERKCPICRASIKNILKIYD